MQEEGYTVIQESIERGGKLICCVAVWKHASNGNVVLAIKGTSFTNATDLANDLAMILGGAASAAIVQPTLAHAIKLVRDFHVNLVTGHSLGGYMTEILATNNNLMGIAFCAPGPNGPLIQLGGRETAGFHNVNLEWDLAGNVHPGVYQHVQWSIYVGCNGHYTHSITNMVDYFSDKKHIHNGNVQSRSKSYLTGYYYPV